MKKIALLFACVAALCLSMEAQEKQQSAKSAPEAAALEGNVRKVWDAFKSKNKPALAAMLSDDFHEMEEGNSAPGDKKADVASVDDFEISTYTLKDFTVKPLGPKAALVTYNAHYEGKSGKEVVSTNSAFGEVWVLEGKDWKALYTQETYLK